MLVNGELGNLISIRDRGLLYGDGVFRTLRVVQGQAEHWPLHYQKLLHDCTALGIRCPDYAPLSTELTQLLSQQTDCALKLIVTRGIATRGYVPSATATPTHLWDASPLPDYPSAWVSEGIKARRCQLHLSQQPRLAGIKHLNRLENVLAASECSDADIAEGLLQDADGNVIEGIRSNLFAVLNGTLTTPCLLACGVAGVQRDRVMAWAKTNNVSLEIRAFNWDEVVHADELFVVNSLMGVCPIRELDTRRWTDFPLTRCVQQGLNV